MMFGSEPFAGTITERPTGITSGGRVAVAAVPRVQHAREVAGRVVAHDVFASMPSWRRASAWSSACSTTAPQNDQEYGTTIPTFIRLNYAARRAPA